MRACVLAFHPDLLVCFVPGFLINFLERIEILCVFVSWRLCVILRSLIVPMKILFNHHLPYSLAHGGTQIQIDQTKAALEKIGVEVEPLRWWDMTQSGQVLHHFGRPPTALVRFAQAKGIRVVVADLLTEQGSRTRGRLWIQKVVTHAMKRYLPGSITGAFQWDSYQLADACLALTRWEAELMSELFGAPKEKLHVVPNGVEEAFLESKPAARGPWLVCTATITERKRVLELAEAAVTARAPLWVVGRPYAENDAYYERFRALAQSQPQWVRYEGPINDRARLAVIYREARGFALLSTMESLSLSALEAAACGCPLLFSDLPWARTVFGPDARYCPIASSESTARHLKAFYEAAPDLKPPPRPLSWGDVARQLQGIYESLLKTSR